MSRETLNTIFTGIQTACAVGAIIWAATTDFPEAQIDRLLTQVSAEKEKVVNLQGEKKSLDSDLITLRKEVAGLSEQRDRVQAELDRLEGEHAQVLAKLSLIEARRHGYFENTKATVLDGLFTPIKNQISAINQRNKLTRTFPEFEEWSSRNAAYPRSMVIEQMSVDGTTKTLGSPGEEAPRGWEYESVRRFSAAVSLVGANPQAPSALGTGGPSLWTGQMMTYPQVAAAFRWELSNPDQTYSGLDALEVAMGTPSLALLLPEDRERLDLRIDAFKKENSALISARLSVLLPHDFTNEDLGKEVDRAEAASKNFYVAIDSLQAELEKDF